MQPSYPVHLLHSMSSRMDKPLTSLLKWARMSSPRLNKVKFKNVFDSLTLTLEQCYSSRACSWSAMSFALELWQSRLSLKRFTNRRWFSLCRSLTSSSTLWGKISLPKSNGAKRTTKYTFSFMKTTNLVLRNWALCYKYTTGVQCSRKEVLITQISLRTQSCYQVIFLLAAMALRKTSTRSSNC